MFLNVRKYSNVRAWSLKNAPTHSNQQLAAPLERFCAKLLGDCKEFDREFFFLHFTVFTTSALGSGDIWRFMYTFCNICRNLTALGIRNALRSVYNRSIVRVNNYCVLRQL